MLELHARPITVSEEFVESGMMENPVRRVVVDPRTYQDDPIKFVDDVSFEQGFEMHDAVPEFAYGIQLASKVTARRILSSTCAISEKRKCLIQRSYE
jgi:hypothetical protein